MIIDKFNKRADKINSLVCVGLDSDFEKIPGKFKKKENPQFEFNKWIINETAEFASSFKFNIAFYEARGERGLKELKMSIDYLTNTHPDIFTICDAKRADIGNTNRGYVKEVFDYLGFDAITLHPYLGKEALKPFLDRADKGCIILCRTSNSGAGEFQDLEIKGKPLWQVVAERVKNDWNGNHNCMLVVGATYPKKIKKLREIMGRMAFLVPGIGAQGGNVEEIISAGLNEHKKGLIVHSARGIIFSGQPKEEAKKLRDEINKYR
ncbi:MAG: orotidine-5'-phosphate decarboxylase [Candidatus Doudnabacteria bacterium CG10_big_fil_rev_8_21_14_0_10_42_18]|uniref:Orotidine-5'-phosphate decarboxylase n=1 Tax=Candidatus Doudnabacteria bacterium CG10_big_fil_rev_8_21_14_0_10_42_18 TaxID=1974552 RepID=A0A2H0VAT9_9BACT|nr:MAG: orotidine-5'-phosphate decarboxylase [Candidatus Doudnabacteria bacterium CG10_big_fil_rev_8_21_14_0_10_42_18]